MAVVQTVLRCSWPLLSQGLWLWLLLAALSIFDAVAAAGKSEAFVDPMKHDLFVVTPKTFDSLIGHHRNKDGVAALLHFKSSQAKDKKFINDVYNPAAKEAKGMVRYGAIDCDEWKPFCKEHLNPNLESPLIVVYPPSPWPESVLQAQDKKSIVKATLQHVPDKHVHVLNDENVDAFLSSDVAVPKVLLFSKKEKPPVLFRALSNHFKDRLSFGLVPPAASSLVARYEVKKFPAVHLLKAAAKGSGLGKPLVYQGKELTFEKLHEWLNVHAETFVKGGGFIDQKATEATPKPWLVQRVPEVTGASSHDVCLKGSVLCAILLTKGKIADEQKAMLEQLDQQYSKDNLDRGARFKFMWMDIEIETTIRQTLNLDLDSTTFPSLVVVNPHKKLRFQALPADQEADSSNIQNLLERIASGDGRFSPIKKGKLQFAPRDPEGQPMKKKEEL